MKLILKKEPKKKKKIKIRIKEKKPFDKCKKCQHPCGDAEDEDGNKLEILLHSFDFGTPPCPGIAFFYNRKLPGHLYIKYRDKDGNYTKCRNIFSVSFVNAIEEAAAKYRTLMKLRMGKKK